MGIQGVSLTLDPLETRGFEYHSAFGFTLFSRLIRGELGRGGRYDVYKGQNAQESAAGFTLYMDTLRQGLKSEMNAQVKYVDETTSWAEIQKLHDEGYIVKRGLK